METLDEVLEHYGILGMKWGVRRDRATLQKFRKKQFTKDSKPKKSQDASKAEATKKKVKKSGVQSLSNKELQDLVKRMNLEKQYFEVNAKTTTPGKEFAKKFIRDIGEQQARNLVNDRIAKAIGLKSKKN